MKQYVYDRCDTWHQVQIPEMDNKLQPASAEALSSSSSPSSSWVVFSSIVCSWSKKYLIICLLSILSYSHHLLLPLLELSCVGRVVSVCSGERAGTKSQCLKKERNGGRAHVTQHKRICIHKSRLLHLIITVSKYHLLRLTVRSIVWGSSQTLILLHTSYCCYYLIITAFVNPSSEL